MDSLLTGTVANIVHLHGERFTFMQHDVTQYISLDGPIDYVFHLASPASPVDFERLPIPILKVGALGTHNALGLAKGKEARFLLASTSEVYGDPLVHPQPEAYWGHVNPVGIRGIYDEAKRFAEALTMAYHRIHHVETRIARIFNTYGPRMRINDGRGGPGRRLSCKSCAASRSRCLGMAAKPAVSATSTIWSRGCIGSCCPT